MTAPMTLPRADTQLLSPAALADLRRALHGELVALEGHVEELRATIDDLTGQTDTDSLLERELAERGLERDLVAIADVHSSLARMDAGTYGICESCGQPVGAARLEAIPHARHCVTCPAPTPRRPG